MQGKSCTVPLIPAFPRLELSCGSGLCPNVSLSENLPSPCKLNTPSHFPVFLLSAELRMGHGELHQHHLGMLQMQILGPHPRPQKSTQVTLEMECVLGPAPTHVGDRTVKFPGILPADCSTQPLLNMKLYKLSSS